MTLRWQDIKSFNNSQNNAFEELVCQLARDESIEDRKEFYRVAAPDGGVEAYCVLENGDEYGWQAKYFSSMGTSQWSQLEESFKTALNKHPKLEKYFICIPLDRQDPRREQQIWFMDRWNEKTKTWADYAKSQGRDIIFEYWGSSELIHRLSQEKHAGRKLFWFAQDDFSDSWFESQVNTSIENLGQRYTPELNIELEIVKYFDAISKNDTYRNIVKQKFHELILSVNKVVSSLVVEDEIKEIKQSILDIEYQFTLSQKNELSLIDINSLESSINTIKMSLTNCDDQTNKNEDKKESRNYIKHLLNEAWGATYDFIEFIRSPIFKLSNNPLAILSGPAGIGKSHLLADIALNRLRSKKSCILLLGQHFTTDEPPWTQILRNLLRLNCNEKQLLGALNAKAEAQGERLLFIIDAVNEGRGKYFWHDHINGFVSEFKNHPWIGLVLSIRSSYKELLIPEEILTIGKITLLRHSGFESIEYQASSFFFAQYGIEQPSVPLLNPEFSNPLFLKLFCEGLYRSGLTKIPKGYGGISSVIEFFIDSINEKLSHPNYFDFPSNQNLIKKVAHKIIAYKLEQSLDHISYEKAFEIADNTLSKYSNKRRFLDSLISEGVFSKNLFWKGKGEDEESVY
jgi:DNA replication protein DnaC